MKSYVALHVHLCTNKLFLKCVYMIINNIFCLISIHPVGGPGVRAPQTALKAPPATAAPSNTSNTTTKGQKRPPSIDVIQEPNNKKSTGRLKEKENDKLVSAPPHSWSEGFIACKHSGRKAGS